MNTENTVSNPNAIYYVISAQKPLYPKSTGAVHVDAL